MEKEKYELWREYLKRSDDYKKLCEIIKKTKKHKLVKEIISPVDALSFTTCQRGIDVLTKFEETKSKNKDLSVCL